MNELVKYSNNLNKYNLGQFPASQYDLFALVCFKIKNTNEAVITYDEVAERLGIAKSHNNFKLLQKKSLENILGLKYEWHNESGTAHSMENVFHRVDWNDETEIVTFSILESSQRFFQELQNEFTIFSLQDFLHIRTKHAKTLYRHLKQWKTQGKTPIFSLDEIRFMFGLDKKYAIYNIDQWVINPSIEELKPYFSKLEARKSYERRKAKGRPKVEGYYFTFDKQIIEAEEKVQEPTQEGIAKVTGWTATQWYCPRCYRPLYKSRDQVKYGAYMYGHTDYKTGGCDFKAYDTIDLLQEYQIPKPEEAETPEQIENKKKLADFVRSIFGR